jgi:hypothetical protein
MAETREAPLERGIRMALRGRVVGFALLLLESPPLLLLVRRLWGLSPLVMAS